MNDDINQARKSYQHTYSLNTGEKLVLDSLLDELAIARKNPLTKMQGCKKWVKQNDMNKQLAHIKSEIKEFEKSNSLDEMALEWWDILQSALTGVIILKIKYGIDIDKLVKDGQAKNDARLYNI